MAVKFIITKKPENIEMLFDGNPIKENFDYDINDQNLISFNRGNVFCAEPYDFFEYKIKVDDVISSNTGKIDVNFYCNENTLPQSVSEVIDLNLYDVIIVTDYIPYEDNFDRILITNITGKGTFKIDNEILNVGQEYFYYKIFNKLKYYSNQAGAKENYARLDFSHLRKENDLGNKNFIVINTTSLAKITSDLYINEYEENGYFFKRFSFILSEQLVEEFFEINITPDIANFGNDANDLLKISFNDQIVNINSNITENISYLNIDEKGSMYFEVLLKIKNNTTEADTITVELLSIKNDSNLVDQNNKNLIFIL